MAVPGIPGNFLTQQANAKVLLTWDLMAGALSYYVSRSTDGVTYAQIATPSINSYTDTIVTIGTQYFYKVQSHNADGESAFTAPQSVVPTRQGQMSLGQLRLASQQRADRVNSNFVTKAEWNSYINQSAFELYDILVTTFEDYYVQVPYVFQTNGSTQQYDLSVLIPDFYKLMGVDCGLDLQNNAWVTLKKFDFIARNRYVYPQISATYLGVFNLQYRLIGSTKLMFIPVPNTAQYIRIWYVPRMVELLADNDILDGLSGWTEYVIVDAAIKALQKEESDVSVLMAQKQALLDRIQSTAMNRDVGQPDTVSDTRSRSEAWGNYGPDGDGSFGGWGMLLIPGLLLNDVGNTLLTNPIFKGQQSLGYSLFGIAMTYFFYKNRRDLRSGVLFSWLTKFSSKWNLRTTALGKHVMKVIFRGAEE